MNLKDIFKKKDDPLLESINQISREITWYSDTDEFHAMCEGLKVLTESKKTLEEATAIKRGCRIPIDPNKIICTSIETIGAVAGIIILGKLEDQNFLPMKASNLAMSRFKNGKF